MPDVDAVLAELRSLANPANVEGMARYGINPKDTLGITIPTLRAIAKRIGKDHETAEGLWRSGIHEARTLAAYVDRPECVTEEQMDRWVADFDSWDVCDQVCSNLFGRTPYAFDKAKVWSGREEEFVRRAGFAMMAALTVRDRKAADKRFLEFLPLVELRASDGRNFVKKAVNWALRQIGKRNKALNAAAIGAAERILLQPHPSARWIARDALRELRGRFQL